MIDLVARYVYKDLVMRSRTDIQHILAFLAFLAFLFLPA